MINPSDAKASHPPSVAQTTLFDTAKYHVEPAPNPNAPFTPTELLGFIAEAEADADIPRFDWLFMYIVCKASSYTEAQYQAIFNRHSEAMEAVRARVAMQTG